MPETVTLEIVTPERMVLAENASEVTAPGANGEFGVLSGHAPFFTAMATGELSFVKEGKRFYLAVSGGFVEVLGKKVTVLAETAELAEEIDTERAEQARDRARASLSKLSPGEPDYRRAMKDLDRALTRVRVVAHLGER